MSGPLAGDDLVPTAWLERVATLPAEGGPSGEEWARGAPRLVADLLDAWRLTPDGPSRTGRCAVVIPVLRRGTPLALKVGWPHDEARAEPLALRLWGGRGAVQLVAADPARGALLLERLDPASTLESPQVWDEEACQVIGGLLARLHVPAPVNVPRLGEMVSRNVGRMAGRRDLPRRVAARRASLARDLLADPDAERVLVHGDLHYGNVLAGEREPWLAIDPKPMAGHPGVELAALLRNRFEELGTGSALRWGVRRRVEVTCEAMGLDDDLGRHWAWLRTSIDLLWCLESGDAAGATRSMALLSALED